MVKVPELLPLQGSGALAKAIPETAALAAMPLSVKVESVLLPALIKKFALFSVKMLAPLSTSTAKGYEAGTVPAKLQLIVQLGGEPDGEQAPEPAALAAPLMSRAACAVAAETYSGFCVLLDGGHHDFESPMRGCGCPGGQPGDQGPAVHATARTRRDDGRKQEGGRLGCTGPSIGIRHKS